ncbi:NAD(P)-binding domain-containing protein [Glutamicibacter sp. JL.03c]|uniref:NADPH-dependent F420 reductase n=1 Tax=Glutamicibacter sp. JL.03c TaxID=2984842 RepID=UPI0021F73129|nr:NAD(P)-binding domain-containing protein [Glutamicibacter sp. JL.03c]UYQ79001.1 NAD(P)-binding domain-containing protein [Glutamicibacter sp. JL.03c]
MGIKKIGILGAGRAGTALARSAASAGIQVKIAGTRPARQMKYHLMQYAPHALAVNAGDIAEDVELVALMVPQEDLDDVDTGSLADVLLIDATNRWEDEPLPPWFQDSLDRGLSSSEAIAEHFSQTRVVKALNHISHWDLDADRATKTEAQRALAIASDNPRDAAVVATLIRQLGFAPVQLADLAQGRSLEPLGEIFNEVLGAEDLVQRITKDPAC